MNTNESNKQMRHAIKRGNLDKVIELIKAEPALRDVMTPFGTWLHLAASEGQLAIAKWLTEAGIELNRRGGISGGNALTEASEGGHADMVNYLLDKGAEMSVEESERNPLFAAIQAGHLKVVRILLERGIDARVAYSGPSVKNFDAYAFALEQGQREIATVIEDWLAKQVRR